MLKVGLTGSIAVGKSFVASVFVELGCHVLDADQTARAVVEPGTSGLAAIADAFGLEVLTSEGALDRQRMAQIVFGDDAKRQQLNSILHPLIFAKQDEALTEWEVVDPHGIGIIDASLMIESGGYKRFQKLIVVHCRPEVQLERLMLRDGFSRVEAERRIASQIPQEEKQKYGDFLIDSSDGFELTRQRVIEVHGKLRRISATAA
jgi:dephospho-CoA kinase